MYILIIRFEFSKYTISQKSDGEKKFCNVDAIFKFWSITHDSQSMTVVQTVNLMINIVIILRNINSQFSCTKLFYIFNKLLNVKLFMLLPNRKTIFGF